MIRQAISCDICGSEKKQTNHWFVAYDQGGELRVGGWNSRNRLRPGSKHLCGQTCMHKLVDDFMARVLAARAHPGAENGATAAEPAATDTSLTSIADSVENLSSNAPRAPIPALPKPALLRVQAELVAMPARLPAEDLAAPMEEETPSFRSRNWHAEAWDRERARELNAIERRPGIASRRRSGL